MYDFDMSAIKQVALVEPLVDVVDPKQVNCSHAAIKQIDIHTGNVKYSEIIHGRTRITMNNFT